MSTQQDIYDAGFETRPPMLNKENYVPWSSRHLGYTKSKPNGKLLVNLIKNGPYVRRIIHEPGDPNAVPPVAASSHEQTNDELTHKKAKQVEADNQAIQTILMEKIASNLKFLNNLQPEWSRSVTMVRQTKDLYEVDYTQLYDFLKFNQAEVNQIRAKQLAISHDPLALMADSQNPQIAQPRMNLGQDRHIEMIGGNGGNQFGQYAGQVAGNQNGYNAAQNVRNRVVQNAVQNPGNQNVGNQNGLIVVPGIAPQIANQNANQNGNGNVVAAQAGGNVNGNNGNQIRCYNCRGLGNLAKNCTVTPRRRDAAYLQT
ncbi:hypothetical protein Tco_1139180 [Tanacetum coccineum]